MIADDRCSLRQCRVVASGAIAQGKKPKIVILATGGTIAGAAPAPDGRRATSRAPWAWTS